MPFAFGVKAIVQAVKEEEERKAWDMWISKLPNMTKDNFINFTDFHDKLTTKISKRPSEEIIAEALAIQEELRKKGDAKNGDIQVVRVDPD